MKELYDNPAIYDERWTDRSDEGCRRHYETVFGGAQITDILDVSFGTGNLTFCLHDLGYEIHGSDLNAAMLARAAEKARDKGIDLTLTQCDFREASRHFHRDFSLVMSSGSALCHVDNEGVKQTLAEMDKLVRPGGYIYIDSRNWDRALRERERFQAFARPLVLENGETNYYAQFWDFNPDGTITLNLLFAYGRDGRIVRKEVWPETIHPFSIELVQSTLRALGYSQFAVRSNPAFQEAKFEDMDWYCLLARK